ncbi:UPF0193 protein EVG1-like [Glandiceps talaboti]
MCQSRLSHKERRQINNHMKEGSTLPQRVHPTTSAKPKRPPPSVPQRKTIDVRGYSGGLRTKDEIDSHMDDYKPDYRPLPKKTMGDKEKDRLAHFMAYGEDIPKLTQKRADEIMAPKPAPPDVDRFEELQSEIEERQRFMADMESVGRGKEFRPIIATEISRLIREMEVIDKKRSQVLQQAIAEKDRQSAAKRAAEREHSIPEPDILKMDTEKTEMSLKNDTS